MYDPLRAKAKVALLTGVAFVGGLGIASGLGWTGASLAVPVIDQQPRISAEAVKPAADLSEAFVNIADVVTPGVVRIQSRRPARLTSRLENNPLRFFGPEGPFQDPAPRLSGGSGFIASPDGYILTNHHVVDGADQVTVYLRDRRYFEARIIGSDPFTDVAVIKIDVDEELPHLSFGDSEAVKVGEWVLAVGNPGFSGSQLDYTVTAGIVSARGRGLNILQRELFQQFGNDPQTQNLSGYAIEDFIQTDAVINPGNSGGPMVNLSAQVVGINTAIASNTGYYQGYGFAIPINLARRVMEDLVQYGHVKRPLIGVEMQTVTPEDAEYYGLPSVSGALVQRTTSGGPAEQAGIRSGDVIVAVDGNPIGYSGQLQQRIAEYRPGDRVTLTLYRDRRPMDVTLRLGEAPINDLATRTSERSRLADERLGIRVETLDESTAREIGFPRAGGVVITDVERGSAAERRGIVPGYRILRINDLSVSDPNDVREALDAVRAERDRLVPVGVSGRGAADRQRAHAGTLTRCVPSGKRGASRGNARGARAGPPRLFCGLAGPVRAVGSLIPPATHDYLRITPQTTRKWRNGRRARLRISWLRPWGFESPLSPKPTDHAKLRSRGFGRGGSSRTTKGLPFFPRAHDALPCPAADRRPGAGALAPHPVGHGAGRGGA